MYGQIAAFAFSKAVLIVMFDIVFDLAFYWGVEERGLSISLKLGEGRQASTMYKTRIFTIFKKKTWHFSDVQKASEFKTDVRSARSRQKLYEAPTYRVINKDNLLRNDTNKVYQQIFEDDRLMLRLYCRHNNGLLSTGSPQKF
ncbi:hypothetical protein AVEN_195240-1 [Araneus ventricosus]|uniref:Uncharacterized protein n=1 Tax=Araneus ventricosus TaxID=182803 RepID=A0A4Y2AQF0_ARAVE|nr:hypothetical protein AVEN_195240-1 [Araneus ventricosus]